MAASARVVVGLVLVGLPAVAAAGWPLGSVLTDSALVDVTERGFDAVEDLVAGLLPPRVDIDDVDLFDEDCIDPFDLICYSYDISVTNLYVIPSLDTLSIQPGQQVLNLDGDLTVTLSSAADPAILDFEAEAIGISIGDNCTVHTDPIPISLDSAIQMNLLPDPAGVDIDGDGVSDTNVLDATVPPISTYLGATSDDLHFDDCTTADVVNVLNDVLSFFGLDIYQLLLDQLDPQVEALVAELPPLIEVLLEGTFSTLTLEEEIDLLGVPLELTVWPSTLDLTTEGMRIGLASHSEVPVDPCVAAWDPGESLSTPSSPPTLGVTPSGIPFDPHAGIFADDDFVNHLLYAAWAGGLLCYDLGSDPSIDLGIPIDTTLFTILAPNVFTDLFPKPLPMEIRTQPRKAPVADPSGAHDLTVVAEELGLGFIVEVDGRKARVLNVDLSGEIGVDLAFDGKTGNLAVAVDADPQNFVPVVTYNEFKPESSAQIGTTFGNLLTVVLGPVLDGALGDLAFPIPALEGVGVTDLEAEASGPNRDYVGAYATVGDVSYYAAGCDSKKGGGCDTSGCSSGCSTGDGRIVILAFPLALAALRRRRQVRSSC